jgi:hypothetical protein
VLHLLALKYSNEEAWYKAAKVYQKGGMQSPCEPRNVGVVAHAIVEAEREYGAFRSGKEQDFASVHIFQGTCRE